MTLSHATVGALIAVLVGLIVLGMLRRYDAYRQLDRIELLTAQCAPRKVVCGCETGAGGGR
jgi:uncharacterized membrane protein YidH (DUF202 family)